METHVISCRPREIASRPIITTRGIHYHPLEFRLDGSPLVQAKAFSQAAAARLRDFAPFDLIHLHEWMTGVGNHANAQPTIRSVSSLEVTRRNGAPASDLSLAIEAAERDAVRSAACVLTPDWLRDRAAKRAWPRWLASAAPFQWKAGSPMNGKRRSMSVT